VRVGFTFRFVCWRDFVRVCGVGGESLWGGRNRVIWRCRLGGLLAVGFCRCGGGGQALGSGGCGFGSGCLSGASFGGCGGQGGVVRIGGSRRAVGGLDLLLIFNFFKSWGRSTVWILGGHGGGFTDSVPCQGDVCSGVRFKEVLVVLCWATQGFGGSWSLVGWEGVGFGSRLGGGGSCGGSVVGGSFSVKKGEKKGGGGVWDGFGVRGGGAFRGG